MHFNLRLVKVRAGINYPQTWRFFRMTALGAVCLWSSLSAQLLWGKAALCWGPGEHRRDPGTAPAWAQLVGAEPGAAAGSAQDHHGSQATVGRMGSLQSWVHEGTHLGFGLRGMTLLRAQVGTCGCPLCGAPRVLLLVQESQSHRGWKGPSRSSSATKALQGHGRQQGDLGVPVPKGSS